jgi:cytochrome P450
MEFNPFLPEVQANPYPYYAYLRHHAPAYQIPGVGFWAISRYDDVLSALRTPQVFSSLQQLLGFMGDLYPFPSEAPAIVEYDPPNHTRLRKLVNRAFTPRRVASLERHIYEVTRELLDQVQGPGEFDLVQTLSAPLPGIVIAELLGVPRERRDDFKRWTDSLIRALNGLTVPPEHRPEVRQSLSELFAYFSDLIATYRQTPGDNLISDMVRAEEDNQTLTASEVLSLAVFIIAAGSETTTNLIANAVLALFDHPEQMAQVQANLALVPSVLEETLRYESPLQMLLRFTTQEVDIAGTRIPASSPVLVMLGSANHDERKFPDPERFDIKRNTEGHVGFGFGVHFCLGAQLARLEAKAALELLLERFPRLARTEAPILRVENPVIHGPKALPLVVG